MNKILCILLLLFILIDTCLGQYSQEFQKIIENKSCKKLIETVDRNWVFDKKKNYYKSNFTPTYTLVKNISIPCINEIKKDDIKILFGNPSVQLTDAWSYYTSPLKKNMLIKSFLTIEFNDNRVKNIFETNCKFINKYWKYHKFKDYYSFSFMLSKQGTQKIVIPNIEKFDKNIFLNVFGKPHLTFIVSKLIPKLVTTNEIITNNTIVKYRYYLLPIQKRYEPRIMIVTFYPSISKKEPAYNIIESINCDNIIDTLKSRFTFNKSLNQYQYKQKKKYDSGLMEDTRLYSECFYGIDTTEVIQIFGKPIVINNKREWEYRTGNLYD